MNRPLTNPVSRFFVAAITAVVTLTSVATVVADQQVYRDTLQSTVWVLAKTSEGTSSGTGVLIDAEKKLIITNYHVVGDARAAVIFFPAAKDDQPIVSRKHYLANVSRLGTRGRVLGVDRKRDLALIEVENLPSTAKAIELASDSIGPGEEVQSIGNPGATEALWVFTSGTVRAVYQKQFRTGAGEHDFKVVETQSPINSGDSGGPVVNNQGQLVAIAQAISPKARLVSYNVDITEIREFLAGPWKSAPLPIQTVLERAEIEFTKHSSGNLVVDVEQTKLGKQAVFVTNEVEYYEKADVRKVWSLAFSTKEAPNAETMMKLLEQSARTKLGAWTVERTPQGEYLVVYVAKLDATAPPAAMKSTIEYVAKLTSIMRSELQPKKETEDAAQKLASWLGG
ncbi:MAG: serine protease Do [Pirellulaceae bacterium]|jgi:serine protease Do